MADMFDRLAFLFLAVVLLPLGLYALINPNGAKKQNADGPYFKTGFANMPLWFFRVGGIVTLGMSAFFTYMFWIHRISN
jgi:hypothetical protein